MSFEPLPRLLPNSYRDSLLVCPRCGGEYLHHAAVFSFDRAQEDAAETTVSSIAGSTIRSETVATSESRNPSGRRNAVSVSFYCETCTDIADLELTIVQHKGQTFLGWRKIRGSGA